MNFSTLSKRVGKAAAENSPALLTALAVTGTITTAYLAVKAGFAASKKIDEEEAKVEPFNKKGERRILKGLDLQEKAILTWKIYIPAATCAAMTITACICSNRISERRAAAMASAFAVSERMYKEYQKATVGKVGKAKEQAIRDELAQARVDANPPGKAKIIRTGRGSTLCYDAWSGRYFDGDIEKVRSAVNDLNAKVINESCASLSDFWHMLGLSSTTASDEIGWNTDKLLDIRTEMVTVNGNPCFCVDFEVRPTADYMNFY